MSDSKDFIVKDKRFSAVDDSEKQKDANVDEIELEVKMEKAEKDANEAMDRETAQLPTVNFATFIFSLNSSALVHLGVLEDPATQKKDKRLPLAKQTIDILGMLEEKTKGNLTDDEEKMLKNILYDLRILYVKEMG